VLTTIGHLVSVVENIEMDHPGWSSKDTVTALRKLMYGDTLWDYIVSDRKDVPALAASPRVSQEMINLLKRGNNELITPAGNTVDVNHIWAAMDVIAFPTVNPILTFGLGISNGLTMATWGGDLANAVATRRSDEDAGVASRHGCENYDIQCYLEVEADPPDLRSDLDGINLGRIQHAESTKSDPANLSVLLGSYFDPNSTHESFRCRATLASHSESWEFIQTEATLTATEASKTTFEELVSKDANTLVKSEAGCPMNMQACSKTCSDCETEISAAVNYWLSWLVSSLEIERLSDGQCGAPNLLEDFSDTPSPAGDNKSPSPEGHSGGTLSPASGNQGPLSCTTNQECITFCENNLPPHRRLDSHAGSGCGQAVCQNQVCHVPPPSCTTNQQCITLCEAEHSHRRLASHVGSS
jgi:hypothetical protein